MPEERRMTVPPHSEFFTAEHFARRREAVEADRSWQGADALDPKVPVGHARGVRTSAWLTRQAKQSHGSRSVHISPQEVVDALEAAGVKPWVLMGLHGCAGYLPEPRATQDVDVMVPYSRRRRAVRAICRVWPDLLVRELPEVVRLMDPDDRYPDGEPKPVVDLMFPWGKLQEAILRDHVVVDPETRHRIPSLEAALASKYAAMLSSHRPRDRKEQDAVDFRRMVRANHGHIRREVLDELASEVWERGGEEILQFLDIALSEEPFPI